MREASLTNEEANLPVSYRIDSALRIVFSDASGVLTLKEALTYVERLRADPAFDKGMNQLFDFSTVTDVALDSEQLRTMARANVFGPGVRRAFATVGDLNFGIARMFEALLASAQHDLRVFRDLGEARRWLGIEER